MYLTPECLNRNGFVQMLECNDAEIVWNAGTWLFMYLKGISAEFQVIRGFSQKVPADLLSYDKIHS